MIKNALFSDLGTPANGAALCCSGLNIEVICCEFVLNKVTQNGGSIYFTNGNIKVYRSLFLKCYSIAYANDKYYGNAMNIVSNEATIEEVSIRLSGQSEKECTDSCIAIANSKTILFCLNTSQNNGYIGASICRASSISSGSKISYIQGFENKDGAEFEIWYNKATIEKSNFINTLDLNAILWESKDYLVDCISCIFWNLNKNEISKLKMNFINCTSNNETNPKLESASTYDPNPVLVRFKNCKIFISLKCNARRTMITNYLFFLQLIIS